ncbi:MAG: type 4a pilus biogenesis protein PilO [Desulfobacterales bacterium]
MKKSDLSLKAIEPYIEKIETLTNVQRLFICLGTVILIVGAFVYFSFVPKCEEIDKLDKNLTNLSTRLARMKQEAAQLSRYRKMRQEAEDDFKIVKKALPEKKEIPGLLASISQSGHESGLEFLLFEPKKEELKDFYTEIPVSIMVTGGYHDLALFLSRVAGLPRVVNVRNLNLEPVKNGTILNTSCTAVTYRFVEKPAAPKQNNTNKK